VNTNDITAPIIAVVGAWLTAIQPDMSEMFWGAVGGYVGMSRSQPGGSFKSQIGTLATSALCAAALTDLLSHVGHMYAPNAAMKATTTATAFLLGWGFFKVADPLVAIGLDSIKAFLSRLTGAPLTQDASAGQPAPKDEGGTTK